MDNLTITLVEVDELEEISNKMNRPISIYQSYFEEQQKEKRQFLVARLSSNFVGYTTLNYDSKYELFNILDIPEIQDLNVLDSYRKKGVGSALIDEAELLCSKRTSVIGIGVGMYPGYGNAQRLYVKKGYIPDGRGLTYKSKVLMPMESVKNDDDLVLYFTKTLKTET